MRNEVLLIMSQVELGIDPDFGTTGTVAKKVEATPVAVAVQAAYQPSDDEFRFSD